mmetsp:Transcript_25298/g.61523  ORF Transcript_25298/g.61523 Transcript_25298/m.61523 type:complete len:295 (+) Transcript_25298:147-1031(+)
MNSVWLDLHDALFARGRRSSSLFNEEAHRCALVQEAKLAVGVLCVAGVAEDASVENSSVDVGDQRSNVAGRILFARLVCAVFESLDVLLEGWVPGDGVGLVEGVNLAAGRDLHVRVGEDELANLRVKGEAVDSVAGGEDHHGRARVHAVARGNEIAARLQGARKALDFFVRHAGRVVVFGQAANIALIKNAEDCAGCNCGVNVGGPIEWVKDGHVVARVDLIDDDGLVFLLAGNYAHLAGEAESVLKHLVRQDIQFLLLLTLNINRATAVLHPGEVCNPRARHQRRNLLTRQLN